MSLIEEDPTYLPSMGPTEQAKYGDEGYDESVSSMDQPDEVNMRDHEYDADESGFSDRDTPPIEADIRNGYDDEDYHHGLSDTDTPNEDDLRTQYDDDGSEDGNPNIEVDMRDGNNDHDPRYAFSDLDVSEADMRAQDDSQGPGCGSTDADLADVPDEYNSLGDVTEVDQSEDPPFTTPYQSAVPARSSRGPAHTPKYQAAFAGHDVRSSQGPTPDTARYHPGSAAGDTRSVRDPTSHTTQYHSAAAANTTRSFRGSSLEPARYHPASAADDVRSFRGPPPNTAQYHPASAADNTRSSRGQNYAHQFQPAFPANNTGFSRGPDQAWANADQALHNYLKSSRQAIDDRLEVDILTNEANIRRHCSTYYYAKRDQELKKHEEWKRELYAATREKVNTWKENFNENTAQLEADARAEVRAFKERLYDSAQKEVDKWTVKRKAALEEELQKADDEAQEIASRKLNAWIETERRELTKHYEEKKQKLNANYEAEKLQLKTALNKERAKGRAGQSSEAAAGEGVQRMAPAVVTPTAKAIVDHTDAAEHTSPAITDARQELDEGLNSSGTFKNFTVAENATVNPTVRTTSGEGVGPANLASPSKASTETHTRPQEHDLEGDTLVTDHQTSNAEQPAAASPQQSRGIKRGREDGEDVSEPRGKRSCYESLWQDGPIDYDEAMAVEAAYYQDATRNNGEDAVTAEAANNVGAAIANEANNLTTDDAVTDNKDQDIGDSLTAEAANNVDAAISNEANNQTIDDATTNKADQNIRDAVTNNAASNDNVEDVVANQNVPIAPGANKKLFADSRLTLTPESIAAAMDARPRAARRSNGGSGKGTAGMFGL